MKKVLLITLMVTAGFTAFGQKKKDNTSTTPAKTNSVPSDLQIERRIINKALKYQDPGPVARSYYNILALYPDSTKYLDSLAFLYFQVGMNQQCILVSSDILKKDPNKIAILELKAVSEKNLGLIKMSLEDFEKLFPATNNIQHLYQIASLQYDLKRLGECQLTIQAILKREDLNEAKVTVFYGQGQSQSVSMEAAVYNMEGVILMDLNEYDKAEAMFSKSEELDAEFLLPKNNKVALAKKKEEEADKGK